MRVSLFLSLSTCWLHGVSSQTYSCGSTSANPVEVPAGSGPFAITVQKSSSSNICLLLRFTQAPTSNASLSDITRTSNLVDYNIVPIARSYTGYEWERVAGPYAQDLTVTSCSSGECQLNIPGLSDLEEGKLLLMSFGHQLSAEEAVSRFFLQTTFGPTKAMINSWDYGTNALTAMAGWVQTQITSTDLTSHRRYYRERVDAPKGISIVLLRGHEKGRRTHDPCDKSATWMRYSFLSEDFRKEIVATEVAGGILLSIEGVPRTVVSRWQNIQNNQDLGTGTYTFDCWNQEFRLGGILRMRKSGEDSCIRIRDGNPPINIPFTSSLLSTIDLPALSGPTDNVYLANFDNRLGGEAYYLSNGFSDSQCDALSLSDYVNLIGSTSDGTQYIYSGFILLNENSLESPKSDGGGDFLNIDGDQRCANPAMSFTNIQSCFLSVDANVCSSVYDEDEGDAVVVCGSPNEAGNGENRQGIFDFIGSPTTKFDTDHGNQKKNVWTMIALESSDQLRQRVAWALSQILVISPTQIEEEENSENFVNYYDIFIRHAFGNYFDVLKEVAYSPMMAEMLSYYRSKSTSYVLKDTGNKGFPDENFAREIMQLFTIGVHKLNMDGTYLVDSSGNTVPTYENSDIQTFARAWTGFTGLPKRANLENFDWDSNRIDPMRIEGPWRDSFPKMDLDNNYIGDTYPLCVDLPAKQFLRKGAKYRLLGSSTLPLMHYQRLSNRDSKKAFVLSSTSTLYSELCNGTPDNCNFFSEVTLTSNISQCDGEECSVDELRLVQIQSNPPVYYEYIRPPCTDLAFYDNGKTIQLMWEEEAMCANALLPIARDACCDNPQWERPGAYSNCYHSYERTTFQTAKNRCDEVSGTQCPWFWIDTEEYTSCQYYSEDAWYWTSDQICSLQAKVSSTGTIAIVHDPNLVNDRVVDPQVSPTNTNYFKVSWDTEDYPQPSNACGGGICQLISSSECLCDITIEESTIYTSRPAVADIILNLHIGGVDITSFDGEYTEAESSSGVTVYHKNGSGYTTDTIFKIDYYGKESFFKNLLSTVKINSTYSFRNPPQFLNPAMHEPRDASYETDALLKHLFYHDNQAPFLALRLIQRFEVSNPSPRYIESVAQAFTTGFFSSGGESFGDGRYGNLGSTIAAVVLDREARTVQLDADPTAGSLREPILKLISFMRAMEFEQSTSAPELRLFGLHERIGQAPHSIPSVFSFFLSEYSAPGHITAASIKSPEAQVLSGPKIVRFLNGIISLVDWGLTDCWGGFGEGVVSWCEGYLDENSNYYSPSDNRRAALMYEADASKTTAQRIDELALLLTGGRLHDEARSVIINAYDSEGGGSSGLKYAQKLIASLPEFHSTNIVSTNLISRPDIEIPQPSTKEYKAVVFLNLSGGCDSHNILVPKSGCTGKDMYQNYKDVRSDLAVEYEQLLEIDASASSQICSVFGVNPDVPTLKTLYDAGDLLWVSNMGVLQKATTKDTWYDDTTSTSLFAHNFQQREVQNVDINEAQIGRGIGGRIVDILLRLGYNAQAVSVDGIADALVANDASQFVVEPDGFESFDPKPETSNLFNDVQDINRGTYIGSGLFSETWSAFLNQGLGENAFLDATLQAVTLDSNFTTISSLGAQMETVAKMMKTKDSRGADRDIFYVDQRGFDTHDNMVDDFSDLMKTLNTGVEEFKNEMVNQGLWDSVTVVMVSEFARTLPVNTGNGSDHAWGGNYFVAGGDVKGKQIMGSYPESLDESGANIIEPGILIPTTPWESVWQGISQWLGITNSVDLDEALPNRNSFSNLFGKEDLFESDTSCSDNTDTFTATKPDPNGWVKQKTCAGWVNRKSTAWRCYNVGGVKENCPRTCTNCCVENEGTFTLLGNGKNKTCAWAQANPGQRCGKPPTRQNCAVTCGQCD